MKLNETALATLRKASVSPEAWGRANYSPDGTWQGDVCGCMDDLRANGFHHFGEDECGCQPAALEQWLNGDPYRWFAVKPPGPVCRIRRVGAYNRQLGRPHHCYAKEDGLTPEPRTRTGTDGRADGRAPHVPDGRPVGHRVPDGYGRRRGVH
jgi:hypothetical protein